MSTSQVLQTKPLEIFYDGACYVCAFEIEHYLKKDRYHRLVGIDIADPKFDAGALGLDSKKVQHELHVRLPSGEIKTGVASFIAIWDALVESEPKYRILSKIARVNALRPLWDFGYFIFADWIRPNLPKKKNHCATGACER